MARALTLGNDAMLGTTAGLMAQPWHSSIRCFAPGCFFNSRVHSLRLALLGGGPVSVPQQFVCWSQPPQIGNLASLAPPARCAWCCIGDKCACPPVPAHRGLKALQACSCSSAAVQPCAPSSLVVSPCFSSSDKPHTRCAARRLVPAEPRSVQLLSPATTNFAAVPATCCPVPCAALLGPILARFLPGRPSSEPAPCQEKRRPGTIRPHCESARLDNEGNSNQFWKIAQLLAKAEVKPEFVFALGLGCLDGKTRFQFMRMCSTHLGLCDATHIISETEGGEQGGRVRLNHDRAAG